MRIHDFIRHAKLTHGRGHRLKKPRRLLPALAIELSYATEIHLRQSKLKKVIDQVVVPRIEGLVRQAGNVRLDDWTDELDRSIELARATFNGITPREDIQDLALKYAQETSTYQRLQLAQSLQTAIGVNVFFDNSRLLGRMKAHVKQNVDLITSIDDDLLKDISGRLTTGIRSGVRVEELRDMIEERYDVTKSKASLIARDQVGKFYGELNRDRQTGLGINSYAWRGTLDQRERPMHVDLEGRVFQWGKPPITNAQGDRNEPGGDYSCRCTAEPVLDDLAF